jgi:phosphonate transport system substrate-binding protein
MIEMIISGCNKDEERKRIDFKDCISDTELRVLAPNDGAEVFRFGFELRASPEEDARQYIPFLEYLMEATGYRFVLRFTPKDRDIVDILGTGEVQLAAVGALTYLQTHSKYGAIPITRGLNLAGKAEYQSVIFVAPGSTIQKIEDLRGKRFAFGSFTSTQGHLIPRIILAEHGLSLEDLAVYKYTGSHRSCADAVLSGCFDVGGMQDAMGKELADAGLIRIIYTSRRYPSSCIAACSDVPPEVLNAVKQALLDFQPQGCDEADLYNWHRTEMPNGFIEARDEDYEELREWSREFGLLEKPIEGIAQ